MGLLGFFKEALNGFVHEELGVATEAKLVEFCDLLQVVFREGGEGTGSEVVGLNVESSFWHTGLGTSGTQIHRNI